LYDVIIVGAGPVGSYIAGKLATMRHKVLVMEAKESAGHKRCCTGIVGYECVRSCSLESGLILREVSEARLISPSGKIIRLSRDKPQACVIDRKAFDLSMVAKAECRGATYLYSSPVRSIELSSDRVKVTTAGEAGQRGFEARAAVIASGFGRSLTESLGMGRYGDFVTGVQTEVTTAGVDEVTVYLGNHVAPGFFAWLVPTSVERARVGLLARRTPAAYLRQFLSYLTGEGLIAQQDGVDFSYGSIPLRPLAKTCADRVLVVGDAAGQVKPTSGGGIYYGLICADIAVSTLEAALTDNSLSARSLAAYDRQWRKKLKRELITGYWVRKIYERLGDGQIDGIFDIMKSSGMDRTLLETEDLSFDWHGDIILRLVKDRVIAGAMHIVKIPSDINR